tara:strand:+ start:1292 stop:2302 length:1011 start_codon:yes stop_codon:yes gene_type:complete
MKAYLLRDNGKELSQVLTLESVADPIPKEDELLIQIEVCGVCRTDLHIINGDLEKKQNELIPGHQAVGIVVSMGRTVKGFSKGDRVGCVWMNRSCSQCEYCELDQENLCEKADFTGYSVHGGYAEKMVIPMQFAIKLPKSEKPEHLAPLLCAGVIGYRSLKLSGIKSGQYLGLYGFGASAHLAIQIASYWGVESYVITRSNDHQAHARELGAVWVGSAEDTPPKKLHASVLFAPVGEWVPLSLTQLKRGGTLAINAIHLSDIPSIKYKNLYHEKKISSVTNVIKTDCDELIKLMTKIPIQTKVTTYPFEDLVQALNDLRSSKINGAAVLKMKPKVK